MATTSASKTAASDKDDKALARQIAQIDDTLDNTVLAQVDFIGVDVNKALIKGDAKAAQSCAVPQLQRLERVAARIVAQSSSGDSRDWRKSRQPTGRAARQSTIWSVRSRASRRMSASSPHRRTSSPLRRSLRGPEPPSPRSDRSFSTPADTMAGTLGYWRPAVFPIRTARRRT